MLKFINLVKLTSTSLLGVLMISTLASKPASANNALTVTIEAAKIQTAQSKTAAYTVDFNTQSGTTGFTKTNGNINYVYGGDLTILNADQWGGANKTKYITQSKNVSSFNVKVNQDQKYFGFWWSAGDSANKIIFKNDGEEVAVFQTKDLEGFINSQAAAKKTLYYGNPNCPNVGVAPCGSNTGHTKEPFAYVNVYFNGQAYDEIVIQTLSSSKFESDNHTFSAQTQVVSGENVPTSATAANDLVSTSEDSSTTDNVLTNDLGENISVTMINGDATKVGKQVTLASGALVTLNSNGTFAYNPNSKFESLNPSQTATDSFSYTIKDNLNNVSTATVTMTINGVADKPTAMDDTASTDENTLKEIFVLQNDSDTDTVKANFKITKVNNQNVSTGSVTTLQSGATVTLVEIADSSKHSSVGKYILKYDPKTSESLNSLNSGNSQTESFDYTVSDPEGNTDDGNVKITVNGITDTVPD